MKKLLLFLGLMLLLGLTVVPQEQDLEIKFKKMFDEFETRVRTYLKTKKITCYGDLDIQNGGMYANQVTSLPTSGYSEGSFVYNTTTHKVYISTATVNDTGDWVALH